MGARGYTPGSPVAHFAMKRMEETKARSKDESRDDIATTTKVSRRDFLSRFQEAHGKGPDFIDQNRVLALTVANMAPGSDTTAISLRTVFYNLLRNPDKLAKLSAELEQAEQRRTTTHNDDLLSWTEVHGLPLPQRHHQRIPPQAPVVGLALERNVPNAGLHVNNTFIPAGTNIGCNAWMLHLDEKTWDPQPERCIPER